MEAEWITSKWTLELSNQASQISVPAEDIFTKSNRIAYQGEKVEDMYT